MSYHLKVWIDKKPKLIPRQLKITLGPPGINAKCDFTTILLLLLTGIPEVSGSHRTLTSVFAVFLSSSKQITVFQTMSQVTPSKLYPANYSVIIP